MQDKKQPNWQIKQVSRSTVRWVVFGIVLLLGATVIFDFPEQYNKGVSHIEERYGFALPKVEKQSPFVLGLDLKGGAHLVYEADVTDIPELEQRSAVDGVRDVIERRVNSLGVAEPVLQTNKSGERWRVIVELAGVNNVKEAIDAIGETPVLEFKELSDEPPRDLTAEEKSDLKEQNVQELERAQDLLNKIRVEGEEFENIANANSQDVRSRDNGGLVGFVREEGVYEDLVAAVKWDAEGVVHPRLVENEEGHNIVRLNSVDQDGKEYGVAHILLCHNDSPQGCNFDRGLLDARAAADGAYNAVLGAGHLSVTKFQDLAKGLSNEPGAETNGGDFGYVSAGQLPTEIENFVMSAKNGDVSQPIESPFGYHIVYKYDERQLALYNLSRILITKTSENDVLPQNERWATTGLSGKQLDRANLQFDQSGQPIVGITFNDEGRQLFADLTTRNVGSLIAIFLDGEPISIPQVNQPIPGGNAVIQGNFTVESAKTLAQRLNAGALPVPVDLVSQSTVGASLGGETLEKSVQAGLIGLLLVVIFMIGFYRLPGLISSVSLVLYLLLVLAVFKIIPVTLTAASIAGLVLSLGMAIDANILVFERMKEELQDGNSLSASLEEGFTRAWFAIRASNISSAITAVILIYLSTSIVKGFAVTLLIGIAMSVFTAVTITRYLMRFVVGFTANRPLWYLGSPGKSDSAE